MKFKEVAHLYLGCKMTRNGFIGKLLQVKLPKENDLNDDIEFQVSCSNWWENFSDTNRYKPILRPFSDMNELEDRHAIMLKRTDGGIVGAAKCVNFLTSKHFDLFGLIKSGEAIDATTLEQNPYKN
jgi:hypothetical protein